MTYTHRKRAYHAAAMQWRGTNTSEIAHFFPPRVEVIPYGDALLIRFAPGEISTMKVGDWAVRGENGEVKCYSDEQFNIKYESIE